MMPNQTEPGRHAPYSTALALLALLELKQADLPWGGSKETRDRLLRATAQWLVERYAESGGLRGWRGTPDPSDPVSPGLSIQIASELLRAESIAGFPLPEYVKVELPATLGSLAERTTEAPPDAGETFVEFVDHEGRKDSRSEAINYLWHPWAIDACTRWLARPDAPGADPADRVRVRRTLGLLVVDMAETTFAKATSGYIFVASETLYALSSIPPR